MDISTRSQVKELVRKTIIKKINKYKAESEYRPFFQAIFDKKTIRLASIVQSLYTSFGMSIYEQLAIILATDAGFVAQRQYKLLGSINDETRVLISRLCEQPISAELTKSEEVELIRESSTLGSAMETPISTVDVYLQDVNECEYFIDITSVKQNKKGTRTLREKMLMWAAMRFSQKPEAAIKTFIGIPYNPYFPNQYNRSFVLDNCHSEEILVQNEFWALFAGYDIFYELIELFTEVGTELESEILKFFKLIN